jgi:hypothetical protein
MDLIVERAAIAVEAAWKSRRPVSIQHAAGDYGEDWVKNISEPELLDRKLTVLQLLDYSRKNVATLVNLPAIPPFWMILQLKPVQIMWEVTIDMLILYRVASTCFCRGPLAGGCSLRMYRLLMQMP